eukprot:1930840-Prymnesium_polylepis.1
MGVARALVMKAFGSHVNATPLAPAGHTNAILLASAALPMSFMSSLLYTPGAYSRTQCSNLASKAGTAANTTSSPHG